MPPTVVSEEDKLSPAFGEHRERILRKETQRAFEAKVGISDIPRNAVTPSTSILNPANIGIPNEFLAAEQAINPGGADARMTFTKGIPQTILENVQEIPGQLVIGGPVEAINETIQTLESIDTFMTEMGFPIPFLQLTDTEGNLDIALLSPDEKLFARAAGLLEVPQLPNIAEPDTATGHFVKKTTQFLTAFLPGMSAVKAARGTQAVKGTFSEAAAGGALADIIAFDANEDNLLTYLNSFPSLAPIIPDYLADHDPLHDAEWEGKIKNAISGIVGDIAIGAPLGVLTEGLIRVLKGYKAARKAPKKAEDPVTVEEVRQKAKQSAIDNLKPISEKDYNLLLGDPERAELFFKVEKDIGRAEKAIKGGKADEFGRTFVSGKAGVTEKQDDIFINMARIDATGDIKELLQQTADAEAKFIQKKRGGKKVTLKEMEKASENELNNLTDLLGRDPGPMSGPKVIAARKWLVASVNNLDALAARVNTPGSPTVDADLMAFRRGISLHYAIQSEVLGAVTETARAMNAMKVIVGTDLDRSRKIFELIEQTGGTQSTADMAKAIVDMGRNKGAVSKFAGDIMKASRWDALHQFFMNNILGLKTQGLNLVGNGARALYSIPEGMMNAAYSQAIGSGQIQFAETTARSMGMIKGVRDTMRMTSRQVLRQEQDPDIKNLLETFNSQSYGAQKIEGMERGNLMTSKVIFGTPGGVWGAGFDWMGNLFNISLSMLKQGDNWFKMIGYNMEKYALAKRQSMSEGLDQVGQDKRFVELVNNPPKSLKSDAINIAHYQTFTNVPEKGTVTKAFRDRGTSIRSVSTGEMGWIGDVPLGKFVLPFLNTPTNVFSQALERTPLAPLSNRIRADMAAGGVRADQAWGRIMMGTALMLHIADMTQEGTLTGAGPQNPAVKKTWRSLNKRPWTVTLPDGRFFEYKKIDPIAVQIQFGTMFGEMVNNMDEEDANFSLTAMIVAFSEVLNSKSYVNSMMDFVAAADPENYRRTPEGFAQNVLTGFVPMSGIMRDIEAGIDPQIRITRTGADDPNLIPGIPEGTAIFLQETFNKIQAKIPGFSSSLPLYRDLWGKEIDNSSQYGMAWDMLSPIASGIFNPTELEKIILDNNIAVSHVPKVIHRGEGGIDTQVTLLPHEYSEYQRIAGETLLETLNTFLPQIRPLSGGPEGGKAIVIKKLVTDNRVAARKHMIEKFPRIGNKLRQRLNLKLDKLKTPIEVDPTPGKPASTLPPQKETVNTAGTNSLIAGDLR